MRNLGYMANANIIIQASQRVYEKPITMHRDYIRIVCLF